MNGLRLRKALEAADLQSQAFADLKDRLLAFSKSSSEDARRWSPIRQNRSARKIPRKRSFRIRCESDTDEHGGTGGSMIAADLEAYLEKQGRTSTSGPVGR